MGREARRVPLDFDWPLRKVWEGYLLPERLHGAPCPDCTRGWSAEGAWLQKVAYILSGSAEDAEKQARGQDLHPWLQSLRGIAYGDEARRPGSRFTELVDGLVGNAESRPFGHDVYSVASALVRLAGLPETWGICETCNGAATREVYPGQAAEAEAWESTDPPEGEGWQMWETTSEGSPISPVFATPEELAAWCEDGATVFGESKTTAASWLAIITGDDFAHVQIAPGVVIM